MKFGLVLEGGASRSLFSVGALDALMELDIWADYCVGASAGIANGISYISRQKERSYNIAVNYYHDKRYMGMRHLLSPKNRSYYNLPFVFDDIPNIHVPFDYDTYAKYNGEVYAAVTNLDTGKCEYIPVTCEDKSWRSIVASCALPILFQPVTLGGKLYMDGGITDPIPAKKALADGCDKVLVILTREKSYVKEEESALKLAAFMYRKYPHFVEALNNRTACYNNSYAEILDLEQQGKIYIIAPSNTKDWHRTESAPDKLSAMYDEGYASILSQEKQLREYLNT